MQLIPLSENNYELQLELNRELIAKSVRFAPGVVLCAAWIIYSQIETVVYSRWIILIGLALLVLALGRYLIGHYHKQNYIGTSAAAKLLVSSVILSGIFWSTALLLPIIEFKLKNNNSTIQTMGLVLGLTLVSVMNLSYNLRAAIAFQWILTFPGCFYLFFLAITENNVEALNIGILIVIAIFNLLILTVENNRQIFERMNFCINLKKSYGLLEESRYKLSNSNDALEQKILTRTKRLNEEKLKAESANRAKSEFLANMSHEIRTPLGAVMGFAELISKCQVDSPKKQKYLGAMKRNGELLSSIISDILDLSKIEAEKLHVQSQTILLDDLLSSLKPLLDLQASENSVQLKFDVEDSVPQYFKSDPLRLRQILLNVIGNSFKFTPHGSINVVVTLIQNENHPPQLAFCVTDTGIGISQEHSHLLFQPFAQADASVSRKYGGTGLGLVISKRLANLLGGDLVLSKSQLGKGSTFTITINPELPVEAQLIELTPERHQTILYSTPTCGLTIENKKILVIDDSEDNLFLISNFLNLNDATPDTALDGNLALEKIRQNNYDLLLIDLQMPVMDGFELTSQIRKEGFNMPIVAITAYAMKEVRNRCIEVGFNDFVSKPINFDGLVTTMAKLC